MFSVFLSLDEMSGREFKCILRFNRREFSSTVVTWEIYIDDDDVN